MSNATFSNDTLNRSNENANQKWPATKAESLANQFSRLGWIGFWIQIALISIPIFLLFYVMLLSSPESAQRKGIDLSNYLSYGSLLVMVFTICWFFRYTRLAKRIRAPELCPPQSSVARTIWIGIWASCLGIFFSMIVLLTTVLQKLTILLATPQTRIPIAAAGGNPAMILTAFDGISLTTLVLFLSAELILLAFSLWLLFQLFRSSEKSADTAIKHHKRRKWLII